MDAVGTCPGPWVYNFHIFGNAIPIFEKKAKQNLQNRPFTCKSGVKQVCISPITPNWGKTNGFSERGTHGDEDWGIKFFRIW